MTPTPSPPVLWVTVPKLSFDLVGVVLGSLTLAGAVAVTGLLLGLLAGVLFVRRKRKVPVHLDLSERPKHPLS